MLLFEPLVEVSLLQLPIDRWRSLHPLLCALYPLRHSVLSYGLNCLHAYSSLRPLHATLERYVSIPQSTTKRLIEFLHSFFLSLIHLGKEGEVSPSSSSLSSSSHLPEGFGCCEKHSAYTTYPGMREKNTCSSTVAYSYPDRAPSLC